MQIRESADMLNMLEIQHGATWKCFAAVVCSSRNKGGTSHGTGAGELITLAGHKCNEVCKSVNQSIRAYSLNLLPGMELG